MGSNKETLEERYIITNQESFYTVESKEVPTLMIKLEAEDVKQYGLFVIVKKDYNSKCSISNCSYEIYLPIDITGQFKICQMAKFVCVMDDVVDVEYYCGVLLLKKVNDKQELYWNILHTNCFYGVYTSFGSLMSKLKQELPRIRCKGESSSITCTDDAFHSWLNSQIRQHSFMVIEIDNVDYIFSNGEDSWNIKEMTLGKVKNLLLKRYLEVSNETGEVFYDLGGKSAGMIPLEKVFGPFPKVEVSTESKKLLDYFWIYGFNSKGLIAGIMLFSRKSNNEDMILSYVIDFTDKPVKKVTFVRSYYLKKPQNSRIDLWKISYPNRRTEFLLRGTGDKENFDFELILNRKEV